MDLPAPSPAAVVALAPTGTLRAAINLSNFLLVTGTSDDGRPMGVSPDMATALAERLGVGVELVGYDTPGAVADDGGSGNWDIGNIGAAPQRAEHIEFTSAYCEIEATFLVSEESGLTALAEVDQVGRTIVAPARAAYGLWLERNITRAELHLVSDLGTAYDMWVHDRIDALGGLRPGLYDYCDQNPGSTILDGRFTAVQQAVGTPKGRDAAGFEYLGRFVEAAKASGLVAELIGRHDVDGKLTVPPLTASS